MASEEQQNEWFPSPGGMRIKRLNSYAYPLLQLLDEIMFIKCEDDKLLSEY
jgi:hypothetical protein